MNYLKIIFFVIFAFSSKVAFSQILVENDSVIFVKYAQEMSKNENLSVNELVVKTGLYFLEKPYVAGTLEQKGKEHLVVNLREFDCTTFVENCVALSWVMKSKDKSFANYKAVLQKLRYRHGVIDGYSSRLHYASDWIADNAKKGIWTDQTEKIGGLVQKKEINFMSTHPQAYPALKNDEAMRLKIADCEKNLNKNSHYCLLPKEQIVNKAENLKNGDIVLFGTKIEGLDFSHMAIVYRNKGVLTFIHASSAAKKVIVQPTSLSDYCLQSKNCNGIAIVRLNQEKK